MHVEFSGCCVKPPAALKPPGLHTTTREPKRAHLTRFGHPDLTNVGQSNFGQSNSGSGVCHGPKGGAQTQKNRAPKGGPPKGGAQNFALFFPSPIPIFAIFLFPLCLSLIFGGVWKRRGRQMYTLGVLGLSCEAPAAVNLPPRGFTQQPEGYVLLRPMLLRPNVT